MADDATPDIGYVHGRWPRFGNMPIPWIARIDPDGPAWLCVDLSLLLECQAQWRCQVCGRHLPRRAWVALSGGHDVVSDAAMHQPCALIAARWCPFLLDPANEIEMVEVRFSSIHADGVPLDTIAEYGDAVRDWTVPHP